MVLYYFALLLSIFLICLCLLNCFKPQQKNNKLKPVVKLKQLLKYAKFKNQFLLNNLNLYINNKLVKNYKLALNLNGYKLIKNLCNGRVIIDYCNNQLHIKFYNLQNVKIVFYSADNMSFKVVEKSENLKFTQRKYHYQFKHVKVIKLCGMQSETYGLTLCFFKNNLQILHSTSKLKKCAKILNQKIIKTSGYNAVLIKNYNQPLKNIFNFKITSVSYKGNKVLVNKSYMLQPINNYLKISKLGINNLFDFSQIFSLKVETKNKYVNNLINNVLPTKIVSEILNNFTFIPVSKLLNLKQNYYYHYTHVINQLLLKKQYLNLYNFLLTQVLGVGLGEQEIYFYKPTFYLGTIKITYQNIKLLINNNIDNCHVLYNGIVYNNVPVIKTNKTKVYNIDKII